MIAFFKMAGSGSFPRGIHPPEKKELAEHAAIEMLPNPGMVKIPLLQHTGAPCTPTVKARSEVALGDTIGTSDAFISAPIHASLSGKTAKEKVTTLPNGRHVDSIPIKAEGDQKDPRDIWNELFGGEWDKKNIAQYDPPAIVKAVREAGLVGLGGAAFPTSVKIMYNEKKPIDTLMINGAECEPYLTADYRLMLEAPDPIIVGAMIAAHAVKAKNIIVGIEDNKPKAIEAMKKAAQGTPVEIRVLKTKYPQGGEKQLILAVLGREVPTGGLPLDVGVVVMNVGTAASVAQAVVRHKPMTHRVVTVTGKGIKQPKNVFVPIGTSYQEVIDFCGGLTDEAVRVIAGGPMMGFSLAEFETPVTKGTSGIVVMVAEDVKKAEETACVRCGRCVDVCPLNLVPTKIALATRFKDWDLAKKYHIMACMECGCCAYACPASLPLVQLIRVGKASLPRD